MRIFSVLALVLLLSALGLVVLYSQSPVLANKQAQSWLLGAGLALTLQWLPLPSFKKLAWPAYLVMVISLLAVLILAEVTRSTSRWLSIAGLSLQPSQLSVPLLGLWLMAKLPKSAQWQSWLRFMIGLVLPIGLILIEPNLGTALILWLSAVTWIGLSTPHWRTLRNLLLIFGMVGLVLAPVLIKPYQLQRLTSFVDPSADETASYNVRQALIAVGSGQWWGRGIGHGSQSHLLFLPERQTDFMFASLAEETGLLGALLVVGASFGLVALLVLPNRHGRVDPLALYIGCWLFWQSTIAIGMNLGLFPVTGQPLPFVAYGGSALLGAWLSIGLVIRNWRCKEG